MSPDEITSSSDLGIFEGMELFKANIEERVDRLDVIDERVDNNSEVIEPYENEDPEVYGIAFPKTMLPLGAMSGTWTADEVPDLEGGTDEVFVRVWLYGPIRAPQP